MRDLISKHGMLNKVDLKDVDQNVKGIIATEDIAKDELVMYIPCEILVTSEDA